MLRKKPVIRVLLMGVFLFLMYMAVSPVLAAGENTYVIVEAGTGRPVYYSDYVGYADVGGYGLAGNVLLLGGCGGYFGQENVHLGTGLGMLGFGHNFSHSVLLTLEGFLGLGGGIINGEGGAVYIYGAQIFFGIKVSQKIYAGISGGYRSLRNLIKFDDHPFTNDYLLFAFRLSITN